MDENGLPTAVPKLDSDELDLEEIVDYLYPEVEVSTPGPAVLRGPSLFGKLQPDKKAPNSYLAEV